MCLLEAPKASIHEVWWRLFQPSIFFLFSYFFFSIFVENCASEGFLLEKKFSALSFQSLFLAFLPIFNTKKVSLETIFLAEGILVGAIINEERLRHL